MKLSVVLTMLGSLTSILAAPSSSDDSETAHKKSCEVIWDGRVSLQTTPADFDKNSSIYDHQFVHGDSEYSLDGFV